MFHLFKEDPWTGRFPYLLTETLLYPLSVLSNNYANECNGSHVADYTNDMEKCVKGRHSLVKVFSYISKGAFRASIF